YLLPRLQRRGEHSLGEPHQRRQQGLRLHGAQREVVEDVIHLQHRIGRYEGRQVQVVVVLIDVEQLLSAGRRADKQVLRQQLPLRRAQRQRLRERAVVGHFSERRRDGIRLQRRTEALQR